MDKTGIELTESMSRLILDGKIVGYELRIRLNDINPSLQIHQSKTIEELFHPTNPDETIACLSDGDFPLFEYDSFNKGIKVGEMWWFTGDYVVGKPPYHEAKSLVYTESNGQFRISFIKKDVMRWDMSVDCLKHAEWKKIGNIYE